MHLVQLPSPESLNEESSSLKVLWQFLRGSWWALFLGALLLVFHQRGVVAQESRLNKVRSQLSFLEKKRVSLLQKQRLLKAQLESGHDPAWVEMVLMKNLGLVPKGYRRVHFESEAKR